MPVLPYYAYLLRIWRPPDPEKPGWLASLEDPHTHQVISFNSVEQLAAYLREKIREEDEKKRTEGGVSCDP